MSEKPIGISQRQRDKKIMMIYVDGVEEFHPGEDMNRFEVYEHQGSGCGCVFIYVVLIVFVLLVLLVLIGG